MSRQQLYKLSIEATFPMRVVEDKILKVTYRLKNIGENVFPGETICVLAVLPENVGIVRHSI